MYETFFSFNWDGLWPLEQNERRKIKAKEVLGALIPTEHNRPGRMLSLLCSILLGWLNWYQQQALIGEMEEASECSLLGCHSVNSWHRGILASMNQWRVPDGHKMAQGILPTLGDELLVPTSYANRWENSADLALLACPLGTLLKK